MYTQREGGERKGGRKEGRELTNGVTNETKPTLSQVSTKNRI